MYKGPPAEFPGIDIDKEDDGPAMELLENTDKERVLVADNETGCLTRGTHIVGMTTVVDLADDSSDSDDESKKKQFGRPRFI